MFSSVSLVNIVGSTNILKIKITNALILSSECYFTTKQAHYLEEAEDVTKPTSSSTAILYLHLTDLPSEML